MSPINKRNIKKVEVFWGDYSLGLFEFDGTDKSKRNMGWESISVDIPADKTDSDRVKLGFVSRMESGSTGPVLDDVRVRLADQASGDEDSEDDNSKEEKSDKQSYITEK